LIGDHLRNLPVVATPQPKYATSFPPADSEEAGGGFSLLQIWLMLRAHIWFSLAVFAVLVGLAFVAIRLLPKSYVATAALIVNSDNTDPLAGRNEATGLTFSFFPTQIELVNNNVVLRPVVDRLKLQTDPQFTKGFVGNPDVLYEIVLANLRAALSVRPGNGSQLLYISATSRFPQRAADIANAVSEEYLRQNSERTNAPAIERAERYASQVMELKAKVDVAQSRVEEFRQKNGMADLKDGQSGDMEGTTLVDLQDKLLQAQNARRQLEGQQVTPEASSFRGAIDSLGIQLAQARATMGPQHPRVLQLESQIEATRKSMAENSTLQLERARELERKYQTALAQERSRLLDRRGVQDEGAKLLLEEQLAKETYSQALRGQDSVKFASVGNYKDVTLVSRAEPPVKSSKPNKMKLFAAALLASFALAVGGPFAYELLLNRRIRCRDDLERHFRIETLAQFGPMDPAPAA
jgi:polysaccharide biosynthesis transport protein